MNASTTPPDQTPPSTLSALRTLGLERAGIAAVEAALLDSTSGLAAQFDAAVALVTRASGRLIVTGMGKSGHVGRKIAATLASTGTPAYFVHPGEASHGDLGMVTRDDVFLALSNSGNTEELMAIVPLIKRMGAALILMTGNAESALARLADIHLDARVEQEACPLNLAPTSSTTVSLAMGDALAVACLQSRGFGPEDFARSHPGGSLGRKLLTRVSDVMRRGNALPTVSATATMSEALEEMSRKGMGMTAVLNPQGKVLGIFTDGDLRRLIEREGDIRALTVTAGMTPNPRHISADALAVDAALIMDNHRLNHMLVCQEDGVLAGAVHMHDLMAAKVI